MPFFGDGSTKRDYTYIADIIDGVLKAAQWVGGEGKRFEVFNLGESTTISLTKMVETIEQVLGKKAIIQRLPRRMLILPRLNKFWGIGLRQNLLTESENLSIGIGNANPHQYQLIFQAK